MAFFATFALVFVSIFRPQEIWTWLEPFRLLDVLTGLSILGVLINLVLGRPRNLYSPQLPFLVAFVIVSYTSTIVAVGGDAFPIVFAKTTTSAIFMLSVMYGARTRSRLYAVVALLAVLGVFVSGVAVHMGLFRERECIEVPSEAPDAVETNGPWEPDGRPCESRSLCPKGGRDDVGYDCERVGLFRTTSTHGRVRWRGQLSDPNELSVYVGVIIPLLLVLALITQKRMALFFVVPMIGIGLYAVILSQSRGGQLVIATAFAAFFISRYRWKGIIVGVILAVPVLLLGGREGGEGSTEERADLLYTGVNQLLRHPLMGMGINQFGEMEGHTAHNAYLLAAVELGIPGYFIWIGLLWMSVKIPLTILRRPPPELNPKLRLLSMGLIVSFLGMAVGIFFLSFTFKQLLFVWLGICGALYGVVQNEHEDFRVRMTKNDLIGVTVFVFVSIGVIWAVTYVKSLTR